MHTNRNFARLAGFVLLVAALSPGCAGPQRLSHTNATPLAAHPRIALLPLENLSGAADAGEALSRVLGTELTSRGWCELVDVGQVQGTLRKQRVRNTAVLSLDQLHSLGDSLDVPYVLTGTVLEHGETHTDEGPIPAVAATLKLLEVSSGRVLWAKALSLTGKDRETVFGFGRETDPARLDARLVDLMLLDLKQLAGRDPGSDRGGSK